MSHHEAGVTAAIAVAGTFCPRKAGFCPSADDRIKKMWRLHAGNAIQEILLSLEKGYPAIGDNVDGPGGQNTR